ncbi:hypothetical protein AB447_208000 [Bacillus glycinifermentans]|uniref:Integrase n=1 Tax=Bacillus glycinifermentans TaxID=1664069 RepID=A0A0T6BIJ9_9BACI|nr:hypothetical protein AB447_208000 [Bacillus glycinifermentans]
MFPESCNLSRSPTVPEVFVCHIVMAYDFVCRKAVAFAQIDDQFSAYYVSERLGHASIDTALKYYAHVVKELREEDTQNTLELFEQMPSLEKAIA